MKIHYNDCITTLKETSIDTSGASNAYMTDSNSEVINFDKFLELYFKSINGPKTKIPASVDALCKLDTKWCFIEFKNGVIDRKQRVNLSEKIGHSILVVLRNEDMKVCTLCESGIFVLVYNENVNKKLPDSISRNELANYLLTKADDRNIRFGLDRFKNIYFEDVYTLSIEEFASFIKDKDVCLPA